jgi:hypothetical protein
MGVILSERETLGVEYHHIDFLDEQIGTRSVEITRGLGALEIEAPPPLDQAGATGEVASAGDRDAPGLRCSVYRLPPCWIPCRGWTSEAQICW